MHGLILSEAYTMVLEASRRLFPKLLDTLGASKALVVTGNSLYTKVCLIKPPSFALTSVLSYRADGCCEKGGRHLA